MIHISHRRIVRRIGGRIDVSTERRFRRFDCVE